MNRSGWLRGRKKPPLVVSVGKTFVCADLWRRPVSGHVEDSEFKITIARPGDDILIKKKYADGTLQILVKANYKGSEIRRYSRDTLLDNYGEIKKEESFIVDMFDLKKYCKFDI